MASTRAKHGTLTPNSVTTTHSLFLSARSVFALLWKQNWIRVRQTVFWKLASLTWKKTRTASGVVKVNLRQNRDTVCDWPANNFPIYLNRENTSITLTRRTSRTWRAARVSCSGWRRKWVPSPRRSGYSKWVPNTGAFLGVTIPHHVTAKWRGGMKQFPRNLLPLTSDSMSANSCRRLVILSLKYLLVRQMENLNARLKSD